MDISADRDEQTNGDRHKSEEVPPDGGFGWVVVTAAHIAYLLSHGSLTSFGPYIVRLKDYFDEGAGAIGGISGIALFVTFFTGSVSSGLMSRFGCRAVIFVGGVMSTIGLAVSSFVPEAHYLYLTYGLITAFGYSLVVTPVMSLPAKYFRRHYALANGIVFAGVAVAWISLPSLSQLMIQTYGWRGAMLLLSALTANICVCGVILKSPQEGRHPAVSVDQNDQCRGQSSELLSTHKAEETTLKIST
ncbi:monocarboxylate transporter 13-like [Ptychodera flava]|uniref:monocarboxylate transporter 13-like n=1 Tax=Ptychodera flava TaxID=63121 RepID=UPI00396A9CD0